MEEWEEQETVVDGGGRRKYLGKYTVKDKITGSLSNFI